MLYVGSCIFDTDGGLNMNIVDFTLIFAGILLHGRPSQFLASVKKAVNGASGIIVQFPFYAGIMGMIVGSGLAVTLSEAFVSISTAETLPFFTFLSAGIVNMFVPSGGGQWAVQAPIMLGASAAFGVSPARTAMAVAWGDTWTNLIQPFRALLALPLCQGHHGPMPDSLGRNGRDDDLMPFTGSTQAASEDLESWIVMACNECCLEHHMLQQAPSACNGTLSAFGSTVMCDGSKARERCGLFACDLPRFWHFRDRNRAGDRPDPGDRAQDAGRPVETFICRDDLFILSFKLGNLAVQHASEIFVHVRALRLEL